MMEIPVASAGQRLDQALAALLPDYSRSRIQDWIKHERVTVNGRFLGVKDKVWGGEKVQVLPETHPAEVPAMPEDIALAIVYEDDALLVVNKPAGLVVHPGSGNWQGTMLNALLHHAPQLAGVPRAGIVHRLDKDTSGLLVVAKTLTAQTNLVRQLQARSVKREYLAVAHGLIAQDGKVDARIGRHPSQRTKMAVVHSGREAVTHYTVLEHLGRYTLIRCVLETGRTHQIRVHLQSIGHALVGDPVYGRASQIAALPDFKRQALHATRLGLLHPVSGVHLEWQVEPPADFQALLDHLRMEIT
ncbi:ribosomal large subunit pseudouridine synthase D [Sulfuriferula multivorans]|uniref:Pseudouridine synthase n=1 Tax=Sulfuriferula multivorans TaxID=1559896 RepID=A0A401JFN9_9PROT|nr:23S rRNA pseudouridine(1911/1915/1917) synthase RluD [Sulfuriferula multivorans]GBL46428.1 ribosomal large subunit pseudouridine synthase D [Sulfuriferula multivorans]